MTANSLTADALNIIDRHGKGALDQACLSILESDYGNGIIQDALKYYAQRILPKVLPIFPTLVYLSCSAAGGETEKTKLVTPAMMLITAAGDLHDDVIDRSTYKLRRKTVFGKYGKEVALLAGDALLTQGITLLNNACDDLSIEQKKAISNLIAKSMYEIIKAEIAETFLWKKQEVTPQEFFEVIKLKGSVAELQCRIGGIIGCANEKILSNVTNYGRVIGILSTVKDEFMDMQNLPELRHRVKYELPPYPVIFALQDDALRRQIIPLIEKKEPLRKDLQFMVARVLNSEVVRQLKTSLAELGQKELATNPLLKDDDKGKEAAVLLQALANEM